MLEEAWLPDDFEAKVDGQATPYMRINAVFNGVAVGPGEHRVVFSYWPKHLTLSLWSGAVGLFVFLFGFLGLRSLEARGRVATRTLRAAAPEA